MNLPSIILLLLLLAVVFYLKRYGTYFYLAFQYKQKFKDAFYLVWPLGGVQRPMEQEFKLSGDSNNYFRKMAKKHPNLKFFATIRSSLQIFLCDPELIKEFNSKQQAERYSRPIILPNQVLFFLKGLLFSEGNSWARQRKWLSSSFTFDTLKARIPIMNQVCQKSIERIRKNRMPNILEQSVYITSNVVVESFFSHSFDNMTLNGKPWLSQFNSTTDQAASLYLDQFFVVKMILFGLNASQIFPTQKEKEMVKACQDVLQTVDEIISKRIQNRLKTGQPTEKNDFLDIYISQALEESTNNEISKEIREQIQSQFLTFLFAGTDTTAHLLMFMLVVMAQNPHFQQKVREEIQQQVQDISNIQHTELNCLQFLHAIMNETLRYYGFITNLFARQAVCDHYIGDIFVKKGTNVNVNLFMLMNSNQNFQNPDEFDPYRWLDAARAEERKNYLAFIPFSSGPRNCIGQHMATMEAKVVIAQYVSQFNLQLNPDVPLQFQLRGFYTVANPDQIIVFEPRNK